MNINNTPLDALNKIYTSPSWCWLNSEQERSLSELASIDTVTNFITARVVNEQGWEHDLVAFARKVSKLLPEGFFETEAFKSTLTYRQVVAQSSLNAAKSPTPTIQTILQSKLDSLVLVIDALIATFGVADFLKPIQGAEAQSKIFKLFIIISLASALATLISPIGAGLFLLSIVAISLIWASIKPTPSELPNATNWTKEVKNNGYTTNGRQTEVTTIARCLERGRHVLITGPSRIGKSFLAKDVAKRIADGEFPQLAKKTVFYITAADLSNSSNMVTGKDPIDELVTAMGDNYQNCILVIDEAHSLLQGPASEKLKPLLDANGRFAHVIAITTDAEYQSYVAHNQAFCNRFERVAINDTNETETKIIMYNKIVHSDIQPLYSENAIDLVYTRSTGPQPYSSLQMLNTCIQQTTTTQSSDPEKALDRIRTEIQWLRSQLTNTTSATYSNYLAELADKQNQESALVTEVQNRKNTMIHLEQEKSRLLAITKNVNAEIMKTTATSPNSQIIFLMLLTQYILPALRDHLTNNARTAGVHIEINKGLIDTVAQEQSQQQIHRHNSRNPPNKHRNKHHKKRNTLK